MTRTIPLTKGYVTLVDDEDYEWLNQWKWCANVTGPYGAYAYRTQSNGSNRTASSIYMHRLILEILEQSGVQGDHRNGNTLDNRRSNLRPATRSQNNMNQGMRSDNTTGTRGVDYVKRDRCYRARVFRDGKEVVIGYAKTLKEARALRESAEKEFYGEFVRSPEVEVINTGGIGQ